MKIIISTLLGLTLIACESVQLADSCQRLCARYELCDDATDESDCREACTESEAFSPQFIENYTQCIENQSCTGESDVSSLGRCEEKSAKGLDERAILRDFCIGYVNYYDTCDGDLDLEDEFDECTKQFAALSDTYFDIALTCLNNDVSCGGGLDVCLDENLGDIFERVGEFL